MSALTFTLKSAPAQRIDCSPLTTDKLADKSVADIAAIELQVGNRKVSVDSLFEIRGDDVNQIVIANSCDKLDFIGHSMSSGSITVEGDVGGYLGIFLDGGELTVNGNSAIYTACEMKAGQIKINGNAGDFVGGARPGRKNGMTGGTVIITGDSGDRTGDHMRRGMILIEGNAGEYCASLMVSLWAQRAATYS